MNELPEYRPSAETLASKEVYTDEVEVIGPQHTEKALEALPVSWGIIILSKPDKEIAGIVHISLGAGQEGVCGMINEAQYKLQQLGSSLKEVTLRPLNIDETIETELQIALTQHGIKLPTIEFMQKTAVRIYKNGSIEFFNP